MWDRMIRHCGFCHVGLSDVICFFQKVGNGHLVISSLFKGLPRVSSLPFEPLNTWGHPMSWVNTSTTWDQAIQQEFNPLQECKCARTLGPTEWWSSEGLELVTLGVWRHLAGLGDRRLLVSSWSLWEPQEEKVVHDLKPVVPEMEKGYS